MGRNRVEKGPSDNILREWIWKILDERGISQYKFAIQTGFTSASISRWVAGQFSPTLRDVEKMAETFDCHVEIVPNRD